MLKLGINVKEIEVVLGESFNKTYDKLVNIEDSIECRLNLPDIVVETNIGKFRFNSKEELEELEINSEEILSYSIVSTKYNINKTYTKEELSHCILCCEQEEDYEDLEIYRLINIGNKYEIYDEVVNNNKIISHIQLNGKLREYIEEIE